GWLYCRQYYAGCVSFFFFQAEDGIRGRNVTGVQTCALPISSSRTGSLQLFRVPVTGGPAAQVTQGGAFTCQFSKDGRYIYYLKEIGRASCRERVCVGGVGRSRKRKNEKTTRPQG